MSSDTIFLFGGLVALFLSLASMPILRSLERVFIGGKQEEAQNWIFFLHYVRFVPVMGIVAAVGIGHWLVTRVILSYIQ